jgi:proteasome accessory factor C
MTRLLAACGDSVEAHVPVAELRTELNVNKKVLEEDINLLNLINFGGGCYALFAQIEDDTVVVQRDAYGDRFARPARLSPLEAKALSWALEFVRDRLPSEAAQALRSAEAKIDGAIGEQRPTVELNRTQVANEAVTEAVSRAIREDRVLEIQYWTESRGSLTQRAIEPHLLANARDAWYVDAYCRRAEARRTFRLDRIRSATLTDERFTRRSGVANPGPYLPFGDHHEEGTVAQSASVWCSPQLARWMVEEHRSRERYADGSALVEIPYASEEWLVKEILKHQGEAVLFEPVALRRVVSEQAERVLARYGVHPPQAPRRRARAS